MSYLPSPRNQCLYPLNLGKSLGETCLWIVEASYAVAEQEVCGRIQGVSRKYNSAIQSRRDAQNSFTERTSLSHPPLVLLRLISSRGSKCVSQRLQDRSLDP